MKSSDIEMIRSIVRSEESPEILKLISNAINHEGLAKWRRSIGHGSSAHKSIASENWTKAKMTVSNREVRKEEQAA